MLRFQETFLCQWIYKYLVTLRRDSIEIYFDKNGKSFYVGLFGLEDFIGYQFSVPIEFVLRFQKHRCKCARAVIILV